MKSKFLLVAAVLTFCTWASVQAADDALTTAVFSRVHNGYKREKLPDGTFKPEYYAISNGGFQPGVIHDASIDEVPFPVIAGVVAQHLGARNYFLAKDSKSADLLLTIAWGESTPFNNGVYHNRIDQLAGAVNALANTKPKGGVSLADGAARSVEGIQSDAASAAQAAASELEGELFMMQMASDARDKANEKNAILLGYINEINGMNDNRRFAGAGTSFDDLISDIENPRYYVIVSAYDFRAAVGHKERKLLWSTRVSIQAQGNRFDERLMAMMKNASKQFGQDSGRLIRQFEQSPKVNLGELKFLGMVSDEKAKQKRADQN